MTRLDELQTEAVKAMPPSQKLRMGCEMIALALACREARLRMEHPDATEDQMREIRIHDALVTCRDSTPDDRG